MNKLIRWYNKNRKIFWLVIVISIIIISLPRALNQYAKDKKNVSSSINNTTTYSNSSYSVISQETVKDEINNENNNVINSFIDYCNNGDIENAYQLLTNECKQKLYPTLDEFIDEYYNRIFKNKKIYSVMGWFSNGKYYTYKINFKEDILSTGNASSSSIEDYYTIVYENGNYKLNINSYIGNIEINKLSETNDIKISVISKDIFIDYEVYNLNVESKIGKSILLDSLENTNTMYLEDEDELHYYSYSHEMIKEYLRVRALKDISIKFNKKYTTEKQITKIVFDDIILDYNDYATYNDKTEFDNRTSIEIEL